MNIVIFLLMLTFFQHITFKTAQLKHSRVEQAYADKEKILQKYFTDKNLDMQGFHLFIRAFKKEKKLEVWVKERGKEQYSILKTYDFCSTSGYLGPKRKEGDFQIPEGVYHINHFNPLSNFYLSLGINYPNASDKILSHPKSPGGAIYIHGNCVTIGCIPITDDKIKELYVLAVEARNNGQKKIPIHIFPSSGIKPETLQSFSIESGSAHFNFWKNLQLICQDFESTRKLRSIIVDSKGAYQFN